MIQGSGTAFPISNLYKENLNKIKKEKEKLKSYKDICNANIYDLKQCYDENYDKDTHETPIDNSPIITTRFALLMDCNWQYYLECRNQNKEKLNSD